MTSTLLAAGSFAGATTVATGVLLAALAAVLYAAGYVLVRSFLSEADPIAAGWRGVVDVVAVSPGCWAGFVLMLAALGAQVVALTVAPLSVVQPVLAAGVAVLVVAAVPAMGEQLERRQMSALVLAIAAVAAISASAHPGATVATHVTGAGFVAMAVVAGVAAVVMVLAAAGVFSSRSLRPTAVFVLMCGSSGLLYGLSVVCAKAMSTALVGKGVTSGTVSALATAYPWLFILMVGAGMLVLQSALLAGPATAVAAIVNLMAGLCALVAAPVVFGEPILSHGGWAAARLAGLVAIGASLFLLMTTPARGEVGDDRRVGADSPPAP